MSSKVKWPDACDLNSADNIEENLRCTEEELREMARGIWPDGVQNNEGYREVMKTQAEMLRGRLRKLKPWIMQLRLIERDPKDPSKTFDEWRGIHPTNGEVYRYATEEEAAKMLRICYPDQLREERLGGPQVVRVFKEE